MPESAATVPGLIAVVVLAALAGVFGWRQWIDRRARSKDLAEADRLYYAAQDRRRWSGSVLMLVIAAGILTGLMVDPRANRSAAQLWALIWLAVIVLLIGLMILGLADWLAIQTYARRHRRALEAEKREVILAERRRLASENVVSHDESRSDTPDGS